MNWGVSIACPKQRVKRRNNDTACVQITIHQNKKNMVYPADVEAQSRFNSDFGRGVEALVTGRRSKFLSAMHKFPPLNLIYFL